MNYYLIVLFIIFCTISITMAVMQYDDSNPKGILAHIAHYFRYIFSGLRQ